MCRLFQTPSIETVSPAGTSLRPTFTGGSLSNICSSGSSVFERASLASSRRAEKRYASKAATPCANDSESEVRFPAMISSKTSAVHSLHLSRLGVYLDNRMLRCAVGGADFHSSGHRGSRTGRRYVLSSYRAGGGRTGGGSQASDGRFQPCREHNVHGYSRLACAVYAGW